MADDRLEPALEQTVRECVREEILNLQGGRHGVQNLLERTRNLIRGAAFSSVRELANNPQVRASSQSCSTSGCVGSTASTSTSGHSSSAGPSRGGIPRANVVPGHPYRPIRKKSTAKKPAITSVPKGVYLIEARQKIISNLSEDEQDVITDESSLHFRDSMVVLKGEFDLITDHNEDKIRQDLVDVFKRKLPLIGKNDFEFVKRERQCIVRPVVKQGYKWDFRHVKNLCGQGRLYVQLTVPSDDLAEIMDNSDEDSELGTGTLPSPPVQSASVHTGRTAGTRATGARCSSLSRQVSMHNYSIHSPVLSLPEEIENTPGCSTSIQSGTADLCSSSNDKELNSSADTSLEQLKTIFPGIPESHLRSALDVHKSVSAAAEALTDEDEHCSETLNMNASQSASEILSNLREQVEIWAEKLKVDEDDVVSDVLHYYKNPNFDPKKGLRFCIKGKIAIDSGGVLRQIYTDVFIALAESKYGLVLFKGDATRKVPVFSNSHVLTGIFEIIGRLIAHSLIQGGPGFPYLAPIIYSYLSSGDLQTAVLKASYMDVIGQPLHIYIDKVQ